MINITFNLHANTIDVRFPYDSRTLALFKLNFPEPLRLPFDRKNHTWHVQCKPDQGLKNRIEKFLVEVGNEESYVAEIVYSAIETADNWRIDNLTLSRARDFESQALTNLFNGELTPVQRATVQYMNRNARGVICGDVPALEPGLSALAVVEMSNDYPCLLITREEDKINWFSTFRHYTHRAGWIVGDEMALVHQVRAEAGMEQTAELAICNFGNLEKFLPWIITIGWKSIIIDKGHHIKNADSVQASIMRDLARDTERHKFMLSLTDYISHPWEIAAQLEVLGRIEDFGGRAAFIKEYCMTRSEKLIARPGANLDAALRSVCYTGHLEAE